MSQSSPADDGIAARRAPLDVQFVCATGAATARSFLAQSGECDPPLKLERCNELLREARTLLRETPFPAELVDPALGFCKAPGARGAPARGVTQGVALALRPCRGAPGGATIVAVATYWHRGSLAQCTLAATHLQYRCQGHMRYLLDEVAKRLADCGVRQLLLQLPLATVSLTAAFESLGFRPLSAWPRDGDQANLWVRQDHSRGVMARPLGGAAPLGMVSPRRSKRVTATPIAARTPAAVRSAAFARGPPPSWPPDAPPFVSGAVPRGTPEALYPQCHSLDVEIRRITDLGHPCCGYHGLYALRDIDASPERQYRLCTYGGLTYSVLEEEEESTSTYIAGFETLPNTDLDARDAGSEGRYANHFKGVPLADTDSQGDPALATGCNAQLREEPPGFFGHIDLALYLVASVRAGEEILLDYGDDYWEAWNTHQEQSCSGSGGGASDSDASQEALLEGTQPAAPTGLQLEADEACDMGFDEADVFDDGGCTGCGADMDAPWSGTAPLSSQPLSAPPSQRASQLRRSGSGSAGWAAVPLPDSPEALLGRRLRCRRADAWAAATVTRGPQSHGPLVLLFDDRDEAPLPPWPFGEADSDPFAAQLMPLPCLPSAAGPAALLLLPGADGSWEALRRGDFAMLHLPQDEASDAGRRGAPGMLQLAQILGAWRDAAAAEDAAAWCTPAADGEAEACALRVRFRRARAAGPLRAAHRLPPADDDVAGSVPVLVLEREEEAPAAAVLRRVRVPVLRAGEPPPLPSVLRRDHRRGDDWVCVGKLRRGSGGRGAAVVALGALDEEQEERRDASLTAGAAEHAAEAATPPSAAEEEEEDDDDEDTGLPPAFIFSALPVKLETQTCRPAAPRPKSAKRRRESEPPPSSAARKEPLADFQGEVIDLLDCLSD